MLRLSTRIPWRPRLLGETVVAEAKGLSLIANNLYKRADSIFWNEMEYGFEVYEVSLHTVDGSWSSSTYLQMGKLSENFISFCDTSGKWGYLRVTQ